MRVKALFGVAIALAFLIPAAPAAAQAAAPGLSETCQTIERRVYKDLRTLIDIDPDTAGYAEVRLRVARILSEATAESLPVLPDAAQDALAGSADDLRAFLKTGMQIVWSDDLRVLVTQSLSTGGTNVKAAAGKVLDKHTIETLLAYLNDGLHVARELDCRATPTPVQPQPSSTPGGALPTTGANTSALAFGGAGLIAFGLATVLLARRTRA